MDCDNFLSSIDIQTVSEVHSDFLSAPISISEIDEEIQNLKFNKAPGLDGPSAEFYRTFKQKLGPRLYALFHSCLEMAEIPDTWRRTNIVVIPKPGKDVTKPQ